MTTRNITGHKVSITKSKRGHYTATVRAVGTWSDGVRSFPLNEVVKQEGMLTLPQAQAIAAEFKAA